MRNVFTIILVLSVGAAALGDSLGLRGSVRVQDAGELTIADVCDMQGADAEAVGGVVLVEDLAALLERERWPEITLGDIRAALDREGRSTSRFEMSGSRCVLRAARAQQEPKKQAGKQVEAVHEAVDDRHGVTVRTRVAGAIATRLGAPLGDLRFRFADKDRVVLGVSAVDARIIVDPVGTSGARQIVRVRVMRDGLVDADEKIRVEVLVRRDVCVVTRDIRRGEEITAAALLAEERWVDPSIAGLVNKQENAVGWVASRGVREGDLLTEDDAEPPLMVARRERVRLLCLAGGVGVEVWMRAEEDARMGEIVRLKREGSREIVMGRVTGRRTAVMDLDGGSAGGTAVARGGL